jgi:hypothetical protein
MASAIPWGPVQQLAFPLLTMIAWHFPVLHLSLSSKTGAA